MNLIQIEWLKVRTYKTFWILIGLFIVISILSNYVGISIANNLSLGSGGMLNQNFAFPAAWDFTAFVQSWVIIFLVFFTIISVSNEFTFRTHRQHIIDGLSRIDFLHSKYLVVFGLSIFSTLIFIIISAFIGLIHGGGNAMQHSEKIIYVFIYTFNYCSFGLILSFLLRKTGIAIILFLGYLFVEFVLGQAINYFTNSTFGSLLPLQVSDELLPIESLKSMKKMVGASFETLPEMLYLFVSLLFTSMYYLFLRMRMAKTDL
jgi:ABC-2 type transport system permease protein